MTLSGGKQYRHRLLLSRFVTGTLALARPRAEPTSADAGIAEVGRIWGFRIFRKARRGHPCAKLTGRVHAAVD